MDTVHPIIPYCYSMNFGGGGVKNLQNIGLETQQCVSIDMIPKEVYLEFNLVDEPGFLGVRQLILCCHQLLLRLIQSKQSTHKEKLLRSYVAMMFLSKRYLYYKKLPLFIMNDKY